MSLKYVLRLTVPERQWLTRIARGRGARPRPALWKVKRARALLKCDAGPEGAAGRTRRSRRRWTSRPTA